MDGSDGAVAWVTGASRGIGRACAERLAEAGMRVLLQARDRAALQEVCRGICDSGGEAEIFVRSVTDNGFATEAVEKAMATWGRLDVLVNAAGTSPVMRRSERLSADDWDLILRTNLTGAFQGAQAAGEHMVNKQSGAIVNVSSVHGRLAAPGLAAYAASKGGLDVMTRTLAVEWAPHGVRVNAVAAGYVDTALTAGLLNSEHHSERLRSMIPMGRFGTAREVADAVAFLCSPTASYITGSILFIDGGWSAQ
jgi:NAD(P)-dependent dehydrogenase (short-subunit alcohol dehydrogenase family)